MRTIDVTPLPPRRSGAGPSTTWALASAVLLFGAVGWRLSNVGLAASAGSAEAAPAALAPALPRTELQPDELATVELFKRNSASVVHITNAAHVERMFRDPMDIEVGSGTGFVWDDKGHVVTNFHVVVPQTNAMPRYYVRVAGDEQNYEAELIGTAPHKDLAVLRFVGDPPAKLRPIGVGTSDGLQVGQRVYAIGNPFGLDQTLTTGIISGLDREIRSVTNRKISGVIQTDAAINPGNSGGPLLDSGGRLIGVNTAIVSPSGAYAGIGFAVPADTVRRVVPELIERGKVSRPGLGVELLEPQFNQYLRLEGVGIRTVASDSAAERAGLKSLVESRSGVSVDEIIEIDGNSVRSQQDLFDAIDRKEAGQVVRLKVRRGSRVIEVPVTLQLLD